jgi:hypothetical protein
MSPRCNRVLEYVRDEIDITGQAPSIEEIAQAIGVRSKSNAHAAVEELVRQGHLTRTSAKVRNLTLVGDIDLSPVPTSKLLAEVKRRGAAEREPQHTRVCDTAPCGFEGCRERVERGRWFCRDHWFAIPGPLRSELLDARSRRANSAFQEAWTRATLILEQRARG